MRNIVYFLIFLSISTSGQKKYFESAIKNGRSAYSFYNVIIPSDKAVDQNDIIKYASEKNYLVRDITTQVVNRFGDKYTGVKTFTFLPVSEIPQFIFDVKFSSESSSYKDLVTKNKSNVYFWTGTNMFKPYSGFYWSGSSSDGYPQGSGMGFYYNEGNKTAIFFKGNFNKGILQGYGSFATYQYADVNNFDKGFLVVNSLHLSPTYNDDMAVLTVDGKKGFVSSDMKNGFYPKYTSVLQEFSNGKAVVLNDKNEEIVINKSGNFVAYTDKQNQIFERKRLEDEERQRIAIENEKKKIHEEYSIAVNSNDETKLLRFYSQYKNSKYDFAREYSSTLYNKAIQLNEKNLQPYKNEVAYNQGNSLVKMIFTTNDGSPIVLKIDEIYDFLNTSRVQRASIFNLVKGTFYEGAEKHFPSIRKPIAYMERAIVNAFWYREGTKSEGRWEWVQNSGFDGFKSDAINWANSRGMSLDIGYMGTLDDDIAREQERIASMQRFYAKQCNQCNAVEFKDDTSDQYFGSSGEIKMENGDSYTWNYDKEGYSIPKGWFGTEKKPTLTILVNALEAKCRKRYCNR